MPGSWVSSGNGKPGISMLLNHLSRASAGVGDHSRIFFAQYIRKKLCIFPSFTYRLNVRTVARYHLGEQDPNILFKSLPLDPPGENSFVIIFNSVTT